MEKGKHTVKYDYKITIKDRRKSNAHNSFLIFLTGLSGSGKSTIANALEQKLFTEGIKTYVLDGDNVRQGINKDLSFDANDRSENSRRIGELSSILLDAGLVVIAAFVAPYEKDRDLIKQTVSADNYFEIFVNTSLRECENRDVKGLYKKAHEGKITNLTGISTPYEAPSNPHIELTERNTLEESVEIIYNQISDKLRLK